PPLPVLKPLLPHNWSWPSSERLMTSDTVAAAFGYDFGSYCSAPAGTLSAGPKPEELPLCQVRELENTPRTVSRKSGGSGWSFFSGRLLKRRCWPDRIAAVSSGESRK